jgi:hypothetical protein
MTKYIITIVLGATLLFPSCNDTQIEGGFEMRYQKDFEIFAGLNTGITHVFEFNLTSDFQNYINQYGVTEDKVTNIIPKYIRLSNLNGNLEYNILWRARLFISKMDGSLEYEIAYREPVPENTNFDLDLIPTLAEVPEQLKEDQFKLLLKLNFSEIPSQSIDTRMFVTFQAITE